MTDLSAEELADIRAKAEKASPGLWTRDDVEIRDGADRTIGEMIGPETSDRQDARNAAHVVSAQPTTVMRMVDMITARNARIAQPKDRAMVASEMMERVAEAIKLAPKYWVRRNKARSDGLHHEVGWNPDGGDPEITVALATADEAEQEAASMTWKARARAAIIAMREPTLLMEAAGDSEASGWMQVAPSGPVWQAMCDAALTPTSSAP